MKRLCVIALIMTPAFGCLGSKDQQTTHDSFRMTVTDVFEIKGSGPVVMGRITAGRVAIGDEVIALLGPDSVRVTVRSIEKFRRTGLNVASAGPDDVGLGLEGVSGSQLRDGAAARAITLLSLP